MKSGNLNFLEPSEPPQVYFLGVKAAGAQGWQPYHHLVPLSWHLGTLTSWNPLGHSRPVTGLIYLLLPSVETSGLTTWKRLFSTKQFERKILKEEHSTLTTLLLQNSVNFVHVCVRVCVCVCVCVCVADALQISVVTTPLQKVQQLDRKPRPLHAHDYFTPSSKFTSICDVTFMSIVWYNRMQTPLYAIGLMNCSREWRNKFNKENKR